MQARIWLMALAVVATACAGAGSSTAPSETVADSLSSMNPSPSAATSASPDAATATPWSGDQFGDWSVVEATVDGLRVRVAPGIDADPALLPGADAANEYRLAAGERVLRLHEAGSQGGFAWWEIVGTPPGFRDLTLLGYVAGGPGNSWLRAVADPGCPVMPTVDELATLAPFMRVACYHGVRVTFEAYAWTIPGEGYGGACRPDMDGVQVAWLQCENINHNWVNASGNSDATLLLHYNPDVLAVPDVVAIQGGLFTVTGHFLDAASEDCAGGLANPDERTLAFWDCATKFVVDQLEDGR